MNKTTSILLIALLCASAGFAAPQQEQTAATAGEQPVTLTIFGPAAPKSYTPGVQDDPVAREITRRTGVILEVTPVNAVADPNMHLTTLFASDTLPDITPQGSGQLWPQMITARKILAMDPYMEQYGQHMLENPYKIRFSRDNWSSDVNGNSDGKLYWYGMGGEIFYDPLHFNQAIHMRWDLYQRLGYPEYTSLDDLLAILTDMLALEPTNADGQKNYGFGGRFGQPGGHWELNNYTSMFGINIDWFLEMAYTMGKDLKAIPQATDPNSAVYEVLSFWNKAYRAGILDPDSFTQKNEQFNEKIQSGRYMMTVSYSQLGFAEEYFAAHGHPEKGFYQMPPAVHEPNYYATWTDPAGSRQLGISVNTMHPEKAVGVLDFLASWEASVLLYNGVQGVHWDMVNGTPTLRDSVVDQSLNDPDFSLRTGIQKYANYAGHGRSVVHPQYGGPVNFFYQPEVVARRMTPIQREASEYLGVTVPSQLITEKYELFVHDNRPRIPLRFFTGDPEGDDFITARKEIGAFIIPAVVKLIIADSDSAYQAQKELIMKTVADMGVQQRMIDFANAHIIRYQDWTMVDAAHGVK